MACRRGIRGLGRQNGEVNRVEGSLAGSDRRFKEYGVAAEIPIGGRETPLVRDGFRGTCLDLPYGPPFRSGRLEADGAAIPVVMIAATRKRIKGEHMSGKD